jgi:membrane-associated phospholipid phosphatase
VKSVKSPPSTTTCPQAPKTPSTFSQSLRGIPARLRAGYASLLTPHQLPGVLFLIVFLIATYLTPATALDPFTPGTSFVLYDLGLAVSKVYHEVYLPVTILLLIMSARVRRCKPSFFCLFWVVVLVTVIMQAIKLGTFHAFGLFPRPSGSDGGFPSGHTACNTAMAYLLTERYPKLALFWYGSAGLIGWSRWEVQAHYPYQVVAGAILGLTVATVLYPRFRPATGYNEGGGPENVRPDSCA